MEIEIENPIKDIVNSIIDNIQNHYSFIEFVNQNSQKAKQGLLIKQYHKREQLVPLTKNLIRVITLKNELVPIKQQFNHIQVHKQYVPNLCGYHATYNLIQCVQSIKYKVTPKFYDSAAFWSYVKRTQQFLTEYRNKYIQDSTQWPWKDSDIEGGDFERTYLKCCIQAKPLFKSTFQSEIFEGIKYNVTNDTIFYQYGNVVNGFNERAALQKKFDQFIEFKANTNEELIQTYMLGVTNHWISFLAHKNKEGTHYIVMDSRNRDFFLWNEKEIKQFLIQENIDRPQRGQKPLNQFYLDLYEQGMKDLQQLITLLVSWLSGQSKLESYVSNQKMRVFLLPLIDLLEISQEQFLNLRFSTQEAPNLFQVFALWADQYRITASEYIGNATQINQLNKLMFLKAMELTQASLDYQTKHNLWNQQKQSPLHQMVKCLKIIYQSI